MDCSPPGSFVHGDYPSKNARVGCHALLQGIFPNQGSNPGLLYCRQILYCLSHQESPRILEWVQFSSVAQSCPTLCDPMDCSMPVFLVHHQLPEPTQIHVHVSDAIQPSHSLSSPSPPVFNLSQHQGLFQWVGSSHQVAKVLEFQWLAYPFSRGSFQTRNPTVVSCRQILYLAKLQGKPYLLLILYSTNFYINFTKSWGSYITS